VGVVAGERADAAGGRGTRGGGSGDSVCEEEGGGTRVRVSAVLFLESILKNIFYFLHHIFYFIVYYFLIFLFIIF
jgi:hypothetical protein